MTERAPVVKRGDEYPLLTLGDEQTPIELGTATVEYRWVSKRTGRLVSRRAKIVDASRGVIRPPKQAPAGVRVEVVVTWPEAVATLGEVQVVR